MNKNFKYRAIHALIMNIPISAAISLTAQLLAIQKVILPLFLINFCLSYIISFFIGVFIPCVPMGIAFANKCKVKEGTLAFGLCLNVVVNFIYVLINSLILSYFNICILGHGPIIEYFIGMTVTFIPIYIVGYIVSFVWNIPATKIADSICK